MEKFVKEQIVYIIALVILIGGGAFLIYDKLASEAYGNWMVVLEKQEVLKNNQERLASIRENNERLKLKESRKKLAESGKVIYEVLGQQFSPEASFGIMFENILSNISNSGLRIRSIDYNYAPAEDKVLETNSEGYNACELSFVAVGTYSQLQNFFKNLTKENYLSGINEIYIKPYAKNKSILVSRFKIRLYTKTI